MEIGRGKTVDLLVEGAWKETEPGGQCYLLTTRVSISRANKKTDQRDRIPGVLAIWEGKQRKQVKGFLFIHCVNWIWMGP